MTDESVRAAAQQEFEWAFGDIVREMDEDGGDTFYAFFLGEFLKGVDHGIANPDATPEVLQVEAALRYILNPESNFAELEPDSQQATGKGSGLVFLYGAHWAKTAASI